MLKRCLKESACMREEGKTMKQCVKQVEECQAYKNAYVICKNQQFNMRSRIQGLKGA